MNHLDVSELACERGERRLFAPVSFRVASGGLLQVAGANGAGKTSLLRLLCGLAEPAAGTIAWNGAPIARQAQAFRAALCHVGHQNALQESLTVGENLRFLGALAGDEPPANRVAEALSHVGLRACERRFVRHLSQGQKRRVALARLALTRAPLWILDEPFVALDAPAVQALAQTLASHLARGGLAVYTSHQKVEIPAARTQVLELCE